MTDREILEALEADDPALILHLDESLRVFQLAGVILRAASGLVLSEHGREVLRAIRGG